MSRPAFEAGDKVRLRNGCIQVHGLRPGRVYCVGDVKRCRFTGEVVQIQLVGRSHVQNRGWEDPYYMELVWRSKSRPAEGTAA